MKKYEIQMNIDGVWYTYGKDSNEQKAQEIAHQVAIQRECWTRVVEVE